jgi:hypothetical protein
MKIPLRLIETDDDEVTASIIRATNRQTEVKEDQFLALTEFAKTVESFFKAFSDDNPLYYERRLRQYGGDHIDKLKIIAPTVLIRAFASMFLSEPHSVTRSYSSVQGKVGRDIFVQGHRLEPYYVAAFAWFKLERGFKSQNIASDLKPARYHLLLAMRLLMNSMAVPRMNSAEMGKFCDTLCLLLWDQGRSERLIEKAAEVISIVANGNYHRDHIRTLSFTNLLIEECKRARESWTC